MTRRDFLSGGGMAVGGLVATSALPVFAEDDPSLFQRRGRFERLAIVYQRIEIGATKPFSVLHISDTHLTAAYPSEGEWAQKRSRIRSRTFGGRQEEALRDSLAWAKEHVDYVLHTGDMIDFQSEANFDLVRKYYGEGGATMFGALGNHEFYHGQSRKEEKDAFKGESLPLLGRAYPFDLSLASTVVNGVNFVTLDNAYETVTANQATRFEAEIKKGLPIVLCMHCPIGTQKLMQAWHKFWRTDNPKAIADASKWTWKSGDKTTCDFVAYLKAQPLLKAILAGHAHITASDRFSPTAMEYLVGGNFLFAGQEIIFE